jgi:hypothetical protein
MLEKYDGVVWAGLIGIRIGTSGGLLWTRQWTFGLHKMLGNSWVAEQLVASQEGLISVELVSYLVLRDIREKFTRIPWLYLPITVSKSVDPKVVFIPRILTWSVSMYRFKHGTLPGGQQTVHAPSLFALLRAPSELFVLSKHNTNVKYEMGGHLCVIVGTPDSYFGGIHFESRSVSHVFRGFHQSLQANAGIVPSNRKRPLPFTSSPIHYSLSSTHSTPCCLSYWQRR